MADNTALIKEAYDGFARGDLAPLLGILDDDVEWFEAEPSPTGTVVRIAGPKQLSKGFSGP